jgi:hypothetical protein
VAGSDARFQFDRSRRLATVKNAFSPSGDFVTGVGTFSLLLDGPEESR